MYRILLTALSVMTAFSVYAANTVSVYNTDPRQSYKVYLNGQLAGTVAEKTTKDFEVSALNTIEVHGLNDGKTRHEDIPAERKMRENNGFCIQYDRYDDELYIKYRGGYHCPDNFPS